MTDLSAIVAALDAIGAQAGSIVANPDRYQRVSDNYRAYRLRMALHPRWLTRRFRHQDRMRVKKRKGWV